MARAIIDDHDFTPAPLPSYSEWRATVESQGWEWVDSCVENGDVVYTLDDAMVFFRVGETMPPIEWDEVTE